MVFCLNNLWELHKKEINLYLALYHLNFSIMLIVLEWEEFGLLYVQRLFSRSINYMCLKRAHSLNQFTMNAEIKWEIPFLAELFRGMLFKWKGANKKSHQKWDLIVNLTLWLAE